MRNTDLFLNTFIETKLLNVKGRISAYNARKNYSKNFLNSAKELTKLDIRKKIGQVKSNLSPNDTIKLMRNLVTSSAWLSFSTARYLHSLTNFKSFDNKFDFDKVNYKFFNDIKKRNKVSLPDEEIFKIIYNEVEYAKYHPHYIPNLELPKTAATIVLIPGVFNELFSTPSFERACHFLKEKYGINYFTPRVNGFEDCKNNAHSIREQLIAYTNEHPKEKLWLLSFSKGGLDTLHYLSEYSKEQDSILGVSTIATPILGSDTFNKKLIKTVKLPGFRSGKIPRRVVEERFAKPLRADVVRDLLDEHLYPVISEHKLDITGQPDVDIPKLDNFTPTESLEFIIDAEVFPDIEIFRMLVFPLMF